MARLDRPVTYVAKRLAEIAAEPEPVKTAKVMPEENHPRAVARRMRDRINKNVRQNRWRREWSRPRRLHSWLEPRNEEIGVER